MLVPRLTREDERWVNDQAHTARGARPVGAGASVAVGTRWNFDLAPLAAGRTVEGQHHEDLRRRRLLYVS